MNKGKLWGGRFQHDTHDVVEEFTASDHFDRRLASYDIAGSIAHARMLAARGLLERCLRSLGGQTVPRLFPAAQALQAVAHE